MGEIVRDVRIIRWMLATLLAIVITGFGLLGTMIVEILLRLR